MDLSQLYAAAVAAYDKRRPYCIAQLQYEEETEQLRLVVWRRYSTKRRARCEPDLRQMNGYTGGLFVGSMSEYEKAAQSYAAG